MKVKKFIKVLISAIYPNKCICCSEIIDDKYLVCQKCNDLLERNNLSDICHSCGFEKDECVCKYNVYRFNELVCTLKNTGLAKNTYYSYKFGKRQHYSSFFAQEMCNAVKECYKNIKFDFICSVPPGKRYTYDHCRYIAQDMSDILRIPYAEKLIKCVKRTKKQHKSTIKERMINANGKYKCTYNIKNACVLLVDDIKTTGATIDECAKVLLFAGADSVYCVTTLGSSVTKN